MEYLINLADVDADKRVQIIKAVRVKEGVRSNFFLDHRGGFTAVYVIDRQVNTQQGDPSTYNSNAQRILREGKVINGAALNI